MKIYFNETTRIAIAATDNYAFHLWVGFGYDPVEEIKSMIEHLDKPTNTTNTCQLLLTTDKEPIAQSATPRADSIKNEIIPKGFPKKGKK